MSEGPRLERAGMMQAGDDEKDGRPGDAPATGRKTLALLAASGSIAFLLYATLGRDGHEIAPPPSGEAVSAADVKTGLDTGSARATDAPEPDVAGTEPSALKPPGFDVVRVAPDGSAVIAGRAAPGSVVTVYADDLPLADAQADADGNFVAVFRVNPSEKPRALTLDSVSSEGVSASSEEVVVLLPGSGPAEPSEALEPEQPVEGELVGDVVAVGAPPEDDVPDSEPELPAAANVEPDKPESEPQVAATAILRPEGVEVALNEAAAVTGETERQVSLASISYGEGGEVSLAGLGGAGARLRAYVDDDFATETDVGDDGRWAIELGNVEEGIYRLRIDQIDTQGRVASRVETPFQRDYPKLPLPRPGSGPRPIAVTVQPGANLWTLARVHYGSGVLYTQIFTANRDLIGDPDLIYPGQILSLPGAETTE
jgi:nucleoid-associated protein YgaU